MSAADSISGLLKYEHRGVGSYEVLGEFVSPSRQAVLINVLIYFCRLFVEYSFIVEIWHNGHY